MKKIDISNRWRGITPKKQQEIMKTVSARLDVAATLLVNEIKTSFPSPPPEPFKRKEGFKKNSSKKWKRKFHSEPGGVPFVQTGFLRRSIGFDRPAWNYRRVGSGVGNKEYPNYAYFLEYGKPHDPGFRRPFLRPAYDRRKEDMRNIVLYGAIMS